MRHLVFEHTAALGDWAIIAIHSPFARDHQDRAQTAVMGVKYEPCESRVGLRKGHPMQIDTRFGLGLPALHAQPLLTVHPQRCRVQALAQAGRKIDS